MYENGRSLYLLTCTLNFLFSQYVDFVAWLFGRTVSYRLSGTILYMLNLDKTVAGHTLRSKSVSIIQGCTWWPQS